VPSAQKTIRLLIFPHDFDRRFRLAKYAYY